MHPSAGTRFGPQVIPFDAIELGGIYAEPSGSVAIAHRYRVCPQAVQQRAVLRKELEMAAFRTFEHHVAAGSAVREERELGENVAVDLVSAAQALHFAENAG